MMFAGAQPTTGSHGAPVDDAMLDVCRERRCRSAERPVSLSARQAATGTEAPLFASRHRAGSAHSVPVDPHIHPPLFDKQAASPPLDSLPQHAHRLVSPPTRTTNTSRQPKQHRIKPDTEYSTPPVRRTPPAPGWASPSAAPRRMSVCLVAVGEHTCPDVSIIRFKVEPSNTE
jgi:hypothetical protein